jgi:hypothetical protein
MTTLSAPNPIKAFREARGFSQEAFGAMFEPALAKSSIHRWEVDGVPLDRVLEVERVTGIDRAVLAPDLFARAEAVG